MMLKTNTIVATADGNEACNYTLYVWKRAIDNDATAAGRERPPTDRRAVLSLDLWLNVPLCCVTL